MTASAFRTDRLVAAFATALMEGLILYVLLMVVHAVPPVPVNDVLRVITVAPPLPAMKPPSPLAVKLQPKPKLEEGAASPANLRSKAAEIVAPEAQLQMPPPLPAAAMPNLDYDATSGAATVPGPSVGSGGIGLGTGSGRGGHGPGGGGAGSLPQHVGGWLRNSDYPRQALAAGVRGTVTITVTIETNGRVSQCNVVRSSGSPLLDETTCRLVQQRYRYRPARDAAGHKIRGEETSFHTWSPTPLPI